MPNVQNIAVFEDTVSLVQGTKRLQDAVLESRKSQIFVSERDSVPNGAENARFDTPARIIVSKKRTFEVAQTHVGLGEKVAVLNFASSTNPGGGVANGAGAQEECLCRISTLYFTLDTDENWSRFYRPHRNAHNPIHNDDILYTSGIVVFKTDELHPERLPEDEWYSVDVITCAAPNLRKFPSNRHNSGNGDTALLLSDGELRAVHEKRDRRIFDVAVQKRVDVLVLGAFGCGAFMNSPRVVAEVLVSLAKEYEHAFKTIEFAVYCPPRDDTNWREFDRAIKKLPQI